MPTTIKELKQLIDQSVKFAQRKVGDTPTDDNQLVPKKYCDTRSFGGQVASDGTATALPTGWTSSKPGTGQYTVTHNLGTTSYGVAALAIDANWRTINCSAITANSFSVITWNATPANADLPFTFVLTKI